MATLTEKKLDYLQGTKDAIKNALIEKGQAVSSTDTFRSYADKIREITGGGDSDGEAKQWKFASGTVTSTGSAMTINHGLGAIPDIIYVSPARNIKDTAAYISGLQFSNAMIEAFNGTGSNNEKGLSYGYANTLGVVSLTIAEGVEGAHAQFSGMFGHIRNANATSFTFGGGSTLPIPSGREVTWWAVSGIT